MLILGIETSCDETAAAVVSDEGRGVARIRSNLVFSQLAEHRPYGGIVPEVAATGGPGLIGGVIVGVMEAKAIALARRLPFLAINHLEAHALTPRLTDDV